MSQYQQSQQPQQSLQQPSSNNYTTTMTETTGTTTTTSTMNVVSAAIPTLRVMRLQKPELHMSNKTFSSFLLPSSTTFTTTNDEDGEPIRMMMESSPSLLQSALCLPDSLTVYVGETFTAYLGVLNTPSTTTTITSSGVPQPQQYPTIRRLSVVAQLQTPSQRYPLPSRLDPQQQQQQQQQQSSSSSMDTTTTTALTTTTSNGIDIPPFGGVDAIVSKSMDEPGPHILRIEVGYYTPPDLLHYQTFRKFYRFNVKLPMFITEKYTVRNNDTSCYTCIQIEYPMTEPTNQSNNNSNNNSNNTANEKHHQDSLVLSNVQFNTPEGLVATNVTTETTQRNDEPIFTNTTTTTIPKTNTSNNNHHHHSYTTAVELFDQIQIMVPGSKVSYLYHIQTNTSESTLRGITAGDVLGHISLQWYKAMGEHGTIQTQQTSSSSSSSSIHCPAAGCTKYDPNTITTTTTTTNNTNNTPPPFVMYRSGRSVDVAATAAATSNNNTGMVLLDNHQHNNNNNVDTIRLITIEPVDPPLQMQLYVPVTVPLLVVNHSRHPCTVQIQFNIPTHNTSSSSSKSNNDTKNENGIVIAGTTHQNIGTIPSHGGSTVTNFTFLPIQTGLFTIQYCSILDVTSSGRPIQQPPLWMTYVVPG